MNSFRVQLSSGWPCWAHAARISVWHENVVCSRWTLTVCKLLIGIVSAYDIHQTVKYVEYLPELELNPVGRWLMGLDDGPECDLQQTACFITAKFLGNFACLAIIEILSNWKRHIASGVAVSVAVFQLTLLYFLVFGEM